MLAKKLLSSTKGGGSADVSEMFSTYVYTGNSTTQDIVNGINLADDGGMVWIKARTNTQFNILQDTERGVNKYLYSNETTAEQTTAANFSFNTDGFSQNNNFLYLNQSGNDYVSWTFKKQPRFFDMVKYTGNEVAGREIPHELGCEVGIIIVKETSASGGNWRVYHRSNTANPETQRLVLNATYTTAADSTFLNDTAPTSTEFTLGNQVEVNGNGDEYIAYLFAHDPLGESGDGSDGMIACGSYVGDSVNGTEVNLGWEPQYVMVKRTDLTGDWIVMDNIRGIATTGNDNAIYANDSIQEVSGTAIALTPTGFITEGTWSNVNTTGASYIYMAIRRPMTEPESSDEVFAIDYQGNLSQRFYSGFPVDFSLRSYRPGASWNTNAQSRLTGGNNLVTANTSAEATNTDYKFDYMEGYGASTISSGTTDIISWMFKRAKGFFDVVCYTGDGVAGRTVPHNLGVVPEMMWVKTRDGSGGWACYVQPLTETKNILLNEKYSSTELGSYFWNVTAPTDIIFTLGSHSYTNGNTNQYIAYLFATLPGISKVGSYTGNGTSQTIDCWFTTGAKFVIIKRTDAAGDWMMWDAVRGIVAGNDPFLELNTTNAEDSNYDSIDPDTSGFIVNETTTNINVSGGEYIYYSIAN